MDSYNHLYTHVPIDKPKLIHKIKLFLEQYGQQIQQEHPQLIASYRVSFHNCNINYLKASLYMIIEESIPKNDRYDTLGIQIILRCPEGFYENDQISILSAIRENPSKVLARDKGKHGLQKKHIHQIARQKILFEGEIELAGYEQYYSAFSIRGPSWVDISDKDQMDKDIEEHLALITKALYEKRGLIKPLIEKHFAQN